MALALLGASVDRQEAGDSPTESGWRPIRQLADLRQQRERPVGLNAVDDQRFQVPFSRRELQAEFIVDLRRHRGDSILSPSELKVVRTGDACLVDHRLAQNAL